MTNYTGNITEQPVPRDALKAAFMHPRGRRNFNIHLPKISCLLYWLTVFECYYVWC